MPAIEQLTEANTAELTEDSYIVWNTEEGITKKAKWSDVMSNLQCEIKCASVNIPTASVLTLNATPVQLVAAAGAGTLIDIISVSGHLDYQTTPYATNVDLEIIASGASVAQFGSSFFINGTVAKYDKFEPTGVAVVSNDNMVANADINVKVRAGDPTAGDSDITIYALYRVITL